MQRPVEVRALPDYKIRVKYADGVEGEADLSHRVGKGVFSMWDDYAEFEKVHISEAGDIVWNEQVDVCPDATYMKITGKTPEELFPGLQPAPADA